jgi:hypothetical protein
MTKETTIKKIITWENYINDCGRKVFIDNELHAKHIFENEYKD